MLGEEFGFLGTFSVIGLIIIITLVTYHISNKFDRDNFKRILAIGIITNFF